MHTRIHIARVGPDVPGRSGTRSYGPVECASPIGILNGFARRFSIAERDGAFSLKWIPQGAARYRVDGVQHRLAGDRVLVLQAGQPYEVEFLDRRGTESFCLFFPATLLKEARSGRRDLQPADMVFKPPAHVSAALRRLRTEMVVLEKEPARLEEALLLLLDDVTTLAEDHRRLAGRVPAKRPATRRRLLGRLQRAREMIDDHQGRPPSLAALAEASSLSVFHFLRLFATTFEATPTAYADRRRVARGKELLGQPGLTVAQVAQRLGFESPSAFARMFCRHVGVPPRAFRTG